MPVYPKEAKPYTINDILNIMTENDKDKPIVVEIGGTKMFLTHAYIAGENGDDNIEEEFKGCLVLDLDI